MIGKTAAIIRAHMGSSRLPGKIMLPVLGRPLLAHLIDRLKRAQTIDTIIIATTEASADDILADLADREGVECFRGSEDDVMSRVLGAARAFDVEWIVDVTSDCPLADPDIVDAVVQVLRDTDAEYACNIMHRTFPRGLDVQVYSVHALGKAESLTSDAADREHVTLYLYEHPELFKLAHTQAEAGMEMADQRLTLDTPADFFVLRAVFEALYPENPTFGYPEILTFLRSAPDVRAMNSGIVQKRPRAYDTTEKARRALGLP